MGKKPSNYDDHNDSESTESQALVCSDTSTFTENGEVDEIKSIRKMEDIFLGQRFRDSELVLGLVGAVGTELSRVINILHKRLIQFGYHPQIIRVSEDIIPILKPDAKRTRPNEYSRICDLMTAGNESREMFQDNSILALGIAAQISNERPIKDNNKYIRERHAYIINSLKRPEEVSTLRDIYSDGFYLVGAYSDQERRINNLIESGIDETKAKQIMDRDEDEKFEYGQRTRGTFHLSDFFINVDNNEDKLKKNIWRILDIVFGHPYKTPTFDEYAMFMAFSTSLRSADLSRQVGAIISNNNEIIATGANDCPKYGGGLYWPEYDETAADIVDRCDGRDYMRGEDSNQIEKEVIIQDILDHVGDRTEDSSVLKNALNFSKIRDITEYGRVVHAEMEALLSCARNNISSMGGTLYCTTFPCHNCAKHIVAAGIKRVVYVEPYAKSKALKFHNDSIALGLAKGEGVVHFEPFVGVGPRRFFDLFSMSLSSGYPLIRKDEQGKTIKWNPENSKLRIQLLPCSYIEKEALSAMRFLSYKKRGE